MADSKLSALTALAGSAVAVSDFLLIGDASDTTMGAGGSDKAIVASELKSYINPRSQAVAASIATSFDRIGNTIGNTASTLVSGRLHLVSVHLDIGTVVTSITFVSGTTACATPTNEWVALFDSSRNLLRQSTSVTTAWAASTAKTFTLSSTFTTTYTGLHYIGLMIAATTVPTLMASTGVTVINNLPPITTGSSSTGLTTTAPNPAAALTATTFTPYAYVS
jgi:hypothetical protein